MEENILLELRKAGNKVNNLSRKIEEAKKLSLHNKVLAYFNELQANKEIINELTEKLRDEL